ncbi:MAG: ABC transporter ATP-binding protein [Coriobacteriia bacterium]|nr:ABC transporter ATP-binding protein [Coriobacteriia bacterium]
MTKTCDSSETPVAPVLAHIEQVHKRFGKQEVLKGIDLSLPAGQITGLLGPSGCGKTTIVNMIVGTYAPTSGTVTVLDERAPLKAARVGMGFMPQSEALYNDLTANENLRFFGSLYGMSRRELDEAIPHVLEQVRLADEGRKVVNAFSGGMKRRLSLAIALLHSPRLLILDEPTIGLDPKHRLELWKTFRSLAENGSALLITTHVMDEAACCDTIIMVQDGRIIAQGSSEELMAQTATATLEDAFLAFDKAAEGKEAAHA